MVFESVLQDLRYGARTLRRHTGFTAVSLVALALGIGINTAAFTAYKAVVARPLDARDPGTMVNLALRLQSGATTATFSYPDYEAYRDRLRSFSGVIAFSIDQELTLTDAGGIISQRNAQSGTLVGRLGLLRPGASNAEIASAFRVSENYFSVLGVSAVRGRTFESMSPSELAASPSVLISENYWQRRFAGDPAVLGRSIRLNGAAFTIVGITPRDFVGTNVVVPNFWLPLSLDPLVHPQSGRLRDRDDPWCRLFGRLAPGVSMAEAQAETTLVASQLRALHDPHSDLSRDVTAVISPGSPIPGQLPGGLKVSIALIMGAVGMVLVIACANAASLQLARTTMRRQELGMRLSLGASRRRVIRQLLTESALLGVLAGCIALPLTWTVLRLAVTKAAEMMPVEYTLVLDVRPDLGVFAYVLAISAVAGILFGLAPAIHSSGSALVSAIAGGSSPARNRLRHVFVAVQVAVSLALLIAGGLLIRSANQALRMETGYDGDRVINVSLRLPEESASSADRKAALVRDLRTRLAALPGVTAITSGRAPNDNGAGRRADVSLNGEHPSARNRHAALYYTWVQANYFQTLGIPLSGGRGFQSQAGQPERSVILSESAARRLWPGESSIGRSLRLGTDGHFHKKGELLPDGPTWQVIGVARDARGVTIDGSDSEKVYLPLPADRLQDYPILARTNANPATVMRAMEPAIAAVDPGLVASTSTLQEMLRRTDSFLIASFSAAIASTIGLFGLLLASMGIYSTVSYVVVLRTREVGIRMAIGARRRDILALMMWEGCRPVLGGVLVGVVLAVGASQLMRGVLYGLGTIDAISFAGASVLLLAIALVATWLPSRRATRVDPLVALRYE